MIKKLYISVRTMDLDVFPVRKAGFKMLYLWCNQIIKTLKNQLMSNKERRKFKIEFKLNEKQNFNNRIL
jgi:hypothetical protein